MADPSILLVAPRKGPLSGLQERLGKLGFECRTPEDLDKEKDRTELILMVGGSSPDHLTDSAALARPGGPLDSGLPLLLIGEHSGTVPDGLPLDEALDGKITDDELAARLHIWCRWGRMARRLRAVEANPDAEPYMDPLTGLPGYRALMTALADEVLRHDRYELPVGLILGDVTDLRSINERYGHATGDLVLKELGAALRRAIRQLDSIMRYSGDTFAIILPQAGYEATAKAAARLQSMASTLIFRGSAPKDSAPPLVKISMDVGFAALPSEESRGRGGLLAAAEASLAAERSRRPSPTIPA